MKVAQSWPALWDPLDYTVHGILQARILEWVASCSLLQGIFPTQGLNPGLLHCRQILYQRNYQGSLRAAYLFSRGSSQPRKWTGVPALQADSSPAALPGKPRKCIKKAKFCVQILERKSQSSLAEGPSVSQEGGRAGPGCVQEVGPSEGREVPFPLCLFSFLCCFFSSSILHNVEKHNITSLGLESGDLSFVPDLLSTNSGTWEMPLDPLGPNHLKTRRTN